MMNTEELKMVLDTIKEVADTAGYVGLLWVCVHYLVQIVSVLAMPVAMAVVVVKVASHVVEYKRTPVRYERTVKVADFVINEETWALLRTQLMRISTSGVYIHRSEVSKLQQALDNIDGVKK